MPVYSGRRGVGGSGGGGGARVPTLISNTDFSDIAALEAFASSNANLLLNNTTAFSTAFVAGDLYHYEGAEGNYIVGQWVDATPEGLTPEMMAALTSIINLPNGAVPQGQGGSLAASGMSSEDDRFATSKSMQTGLGSFFLEDAFAIESSGRTMTIRSVPDPTSVFRLLVAEPSNIPRVLLDRPDQTQIFQPIDIDTITNPDFSVAIPAFDTQNPENGQYVKQVTMRIDPSSVLTNITIAISIGGTLFQDYFFPVINPTGVENEFAFDYTPPIDVLIGDLFRVEITSPDGDVVVKGDTASGIPYQSVVLALTDIKQLALEEDIEHPVTLRRDMPSLEDSLALANASLNGNSALWIAANDQLTNSNRAEAQIQALRAGFLDLDGNEIPTTPVAANTLQLRGGTTIRIFGQNDFRVVNSPVFEQDIPALRPPVEINAQEFTITTANYTNYLDRTIRLTNTNSGIVQVIRFGTIASFLALNPTRDISFSFIVNRGASNLRGDFIAGAGNTIGGQTTQQRLNDETITIELPNSGTDWLITSSITAIPDNVPTTPQPRFTRFQFQTQETSVAPATTISGLKTFLIGVERPDLVNGHLTISQDGAVLTSNTLQPTVRSAGIPINAVTLANAGDTTTFTIEATATDGTVIRDHITIRAYQPHELAYWDIRPDNDFAVINTNTLNSVDVTTNSSFDVSGNYPDGSYIGILVPETHDAREITTFNLPAKALFTRLADARVISGVNYILYTLQNNGGIDGIATYNVEV